MPTSTDASPDPDLAPRDLWRGAFAFVMATGIVSTAILNSGAHIAAAVLFAIANVTYFTLAVRVLFRWEHHRAAGDGGFMTLTFVAASGVLGAHYAFLELRIATLVFVVISIASWVVLGYTVTARAVAAAATAKRASFADELSQVDGTWFLWVVSTQSVAVVCGAYATHFGSHGLATFAALCWSVGVVKFGLIASLEFSRLMLHRLAPRETVAPYWIFMGSAAITVLAGAQILGLSSEQSLLEPGVVATVSMVLWSFATWLVPLLIVLFVWQLSRRPGVPRFRTAWWSMVFPIGMYGEASRQLGTIHGTGWLTGVGRWEAWAALAVWAVTCTVLLTQLASAHRAARSRTMHS
ncbi:tellurite resistance/C4-dicarboxylate transporter family protein [Tomitella gaofuii]|uniref:tellurite resistance/C4-dicarboxylate transporter family protein n=1 Tax=Tomitella gaofuii TaxID=2760083 RepID=UPI0015FE3AB8|nr:tellurite resistance/C4-dicarboxylate transporter family protein [Tomitella gaofuii]